VTLKTVVKIGLHRNPISSRVYFRGVVVRAQRFRCPKLVSYDRQSRNALGKFKNLPSYGLFYRDYKVYAVAAGTVYFAPFESLAMTIIIIIIIIIVVALCGRRIIIVTTYRIRRRRRTVRRRPEDRCESGTQLFRAHNNNNK